MKMDCSKALYKCSFKSRKGITIQHNTAEEEEAADSYSVQRPSSAPLTGTTALSGTRLCAKPLLALAWARKLCRMLKKHHPNSAAPVKELP